MGKREEKEERAGLVEFGPVRLSVWGEAEGGQGEVEANVQEGKKWGAGVK